MNFDRNRVGMVKRQYPVGTRIQLDSLCTDEKDMPSGLCGTVIGVDDQPSLLMKWDNGRSLSLLPFEDSFTVIHEVRRGTPDEQLYEKVRQEQAAFRDELLTWRPEGILDKAWEYLVREDILLTMEYNELDDAQAQALLELPDTMSDLCGRLMEKDTRQQEVIWHEIVTRANILVAGQQPGQEQSL
ncbi:DUF3848 domain-containing protein [Acutalibacter muris]|jgi:hypothetical protein|uniref:DUF3848 domain-containing protein n=1 Tax=Acutalibacter muris TaxID=1796620 RepID=UPI0026F3A83B|nr:DUF4314 domain-containing protein [Acutalibacter muris]